ncbi:aminotransferase class I/II-fold pyridoxal phosphate-dependent enzyme [Rhizobium sp. RAF56]|uniref:aminotransferase class I/II-fold pyridoxal phosphate-dependent enzyme n=1 Tax=Rhizobium sp. RAF56 TaxID=3233062 RepID=UPI003F9D1C99
MKSNYEAPISDVAFDRLLDSMHSKSTHNVSNSPAVDVRKHRDLSFESHPLYQQMKMQRDFAKLLLIKDPYYRRHESKAGATSVISGKTITNFASYDYLGLNGHPEILAAVNDAIARLGTSVSASRISAGERGVHRDLELSLAKVYESEDCIAYVSGHAAAVSTLATLMGPKDLIVHDAVIHNCIVVGAQLSGAARRFFPHNDLSALERLLEDERDNFEQVLIVSEGLFSMDGDGPDLARLIDIKQRYGALLMMDDAHGLGVLGATGRGIFEHQGVVPSAVDMWLGTLSKSLVSCGGYVAASGVIVDILKHNAPGFVYSVGMPASAAVASTVALDIMLREPERVACLRELSKRFYERARAGGLNLGQSWGIGIVPVLIGDTLKTLRVSERLLQLGFNAFPILPPGVPEKSSRLRFFINQTHTNEQIDGVVDACIEIMR